MNKAIKIIISMCLAAYALVFNLLFCIGDVPEDLFPLVATVNVLAIIFGLATLFQKK